MAKVKINTDKITKNLLPAVDSNLKIINNCLNSANSIDSSYIDYDWNSLKNDIHDCYDNTKSFKTWITDIRDKMSTDASEIVDDVNSIEVNSIKNIDFIVK